MLYTIEQLCGLPVRLIVLLQELLSRNKVTIVDITGFSELVVNEHIETFYWNNNDKERTKRKLINDRLDEIINVRSVSRITVYLHFVCS